MPSCPSMRKGYSRPARTVYWSDVLRSRSSAFPCGRCLSLRADGAEYTVRLKEPIEEQDSFVWLSYELVFRLATDGQTQGRPYGGRVAIARQPNQHPFAARSAVTAELAALPATWRAGGAGNT